MVFMYGNSSLISMPDWPHRSNLNLLGATEIAFGHGHRGDALAVADGVRQVLIEMIGQSWFMIARSICDGAPFMAVNQPLSPGRKMRQVGQGRMYVLTGPGPVWRSTRCRV